MELSQKPPVCPKIDRRRTSICKRLLGILQNKRGFHKRSINSNGNWNMTSSLSLINMPILKYSDEIKSAVLIVHGEKAHSRYFGEDAFKKLKGDNKKLLIVKDANHVDLYDNLEKFRLSKLGNFLIKTCKAGANWTEEIL